MQTKLGHESLDDDHHNNKLARSANERKQSVFATSANDISANNKLLNDNSNEPILMSDTDEYHSHANHLDQVATTQLNTNANTNNNNNNDLCVVIHANKGVQHADKLFKNRNV